MYLLDTPHTAQWHIMTPLKRRVTQWVCVFYHSPQSVDAISSHTSQQIFIKCFFSLKILLFNIVLLLLMNIIHCWVSLDKLLFSAITSIRWFHPQYHIGWGPAHVFLVGNSELWMDSHAMLLTRANNPAGEWWSEKHHRQIPYQMTPISRILGVIH